MTVRSKYAYAASPTKEYVFATDMNAIGKMFGNTRLIGASTPGTNLTGTNGGLAIDYPQSAHLRVCLVGQRDSGVQTEFPYVYLNVLTRATVGGPSLDTGDIYTPGNAYEFFRCEQFKDPATWVESGRSDRWIDTDGYKLIFTGNTGISDTGPHPEQLFWLQLHLMTFFGNRFIKGTEQGSDFAAPAHNRLWLNITPSAGMAYVRNLMVWEWVRHPDTVNYEIPEPFDDFPSPIDRPNRRRDASAQSEGMGSTFDIFTGK